MTGGMITLKLNMKEMALMQGIQQRLPVPINTINIVGMKESSMVIAHIISEEAVTIMRTPKQNRTIIYLSMTISFTIPINKNLSMKAVRGEPHPT